MWIVDVAYTRIKLCWFDYLEAAYEASHVGADTLGFHIIRSSTSDWRKKATRFAEFFEVLPDHIGKTLLIDFSYDVIVECLKTARFDSIQLYPDWTPEQIRRMRDECGYPIKVMKVMSAKSSENAPPDDAAFLELYASCVDAVLLDSSREGGTGEIADLDHCARIVEKSPIPVFLAGGLNVGNIDAVLRHVRPFGVDVETGVSDVIRPGYMLKNLGKCRAFVDAVARTDRELIREASRQHRG